MKKPTEAQKLKLVEELNSRLETLLADIREKTINQFNYSLDANIHTGIVKIDECVEHSIECGLVSAIGKLVQWDIDATVKLAIHVLENSNCHSEARVLNDALPKIAKDREDFIAEMEKQFN